MLTFQKDKVFGRVYVAKDISVGRFEMKNFSALSAHFPNIIMEIFFVLQAHIRNLNPKIFRASRKHIHCIPRITNKSSTNFSSAIYTRNCLKHSAYQLFCAIRGFANEIFRRKFWVLKWPSAERKTF